MGGRLLFRDATGREGAVDLDPNITLFIGRGLECAVRTDDGMVSRRHSSVRMENGRFLIEDMQSANGTVINNQRIQRHVLSHNDVVQCGSIILRYIEDGPLIPPHVARPPVAGEPQAKGANSPGQRQSATKKAMVSPPSSRPAA